MAFSFRPAKREAISLIVGLAGPSGGGKTWTANVLATGLAGGHPYAVIDTEAGRAKHYADRFKFDHGDLAPPFRPDRYVEAIKAADAAGYPVIVVDSFSHEHAGEGGLLDWHEEEWQRMGGKDSAKMLAWVKPKTAHRAMISKLLQVRAHLILCMRAEEKIDMVRNPQTGKTEIVPKQTLAGYKGWIPICEKNLPFELTASFILTPDKPGYPQPIKLPDQFKPFFPLDQPISEASGQRLAEWAKGGATADGTRDHRGAMPDPLSPGATSGGGTGGAPSTQEAMATDYAANIAASATADEAKEWYTRAFRKKAQFGDQWPIVETAKEDAKRRLGA